MPHQLSANRTSLTRWPRELRVTWLLASVTWIGTVITGIALSWLMTMQNLGNTSSPWSRCDAITGRIISDSASTVVVLLSLFLLLPLMRRRKNDVLVGSQPHVTQSLFPVLLSWTLGALVNTGGIGLYSGLYCPDTNIMSASTLAGDVIIRLLASVFVIVPVIYAGSVENSLVAANQEIIRSSELLIGAVEEERTNLFDLVHGDIQGTLLGLEILATRQSTHPIKNEFFGLEVALISRELRTGPVAQVADVIGPVRIVGTIEGSIIRIIESLEARDGISVVITPEFVELEGKQDSHRFDEKFKRLLVRISQELILNAIKHGSRDENVLSIGIEKLKGQQFISVSMENISDETTFSPGRGLTEISARARLAGGNFAAELKDKRFTVELLLPVPAQN